MTPCGKVDRRVLPEPDAASTLRTAAHQAAEGETERALVAIWQRVLGTADVGVGA